MAQDEEYASPDMRSSLNVQPSRLQGKMGTGAGDLSTYRTSASVNNGHQHKISSHKITQWRECQTKFDNVMMTVDQDLSHHMGNNC